jgi:alkanesulfonate monooxygenase SsuD/methylene tetrahydromethanopterin reductase-like flavin-dependent oxidoreductase (luciferase family)
MCYPRPLQAKVPLLVGGSGERKTLRLVARYADACNLFGDPAVVRRKVDVLWGHCRDVGRDPAEIEVTHLTDVLVGWDRAEVDELVAAHKPKNMPAERFASRVHAGTVDDHEARFRSFADAGVQHAIVSLADLSGPEEVERFGGLIERFR